LATSTRLKKGDEQAEYFELVSTIVQIFHDSTKPPWYNAEPEESNSRCKVIDTGDGKWFCEKTDQTYDTCRQLWILNTVLSDFAGGDKVTAFNEHATIILDNANATEVCNKLDAAMAEDEDGNKDEFDKVFTGSMWREYLFKIKAIKESYDGEERTKYSVVGVEPINYEKENAKLIELLEAI